ncbi:hypothetical protein RUM44_001759 [Polyplax serrata]|uniref:Uncharacterized protein n=1 Tax=Polyplax serrata TaxID=468196 RepID=A0ABR1ALN9_POLSC
MKGVFVGALVALTWDLGLSIIMRDQNETVSWQCLEPRHENENVVEIGESIFTCAKKNLYIGLMNNVESECVDVGDGVTFTRTEHGPPATREFFPSHEPATVRGLMDAYSTFLSQRSARWDLGFVYPGLVLKIGPTMSGSGFLEFGLEKRLDYHDRAKLGPGQMIIRRTILPHLLGFRMNLSSLLPLIMGVILLVTKNAFVFSKVTLVLSVLLTLKSLFLLQIFRQPDNQVHHHHQTFNSRPPIAQDPVEFDDEVTITTVNRPRPQGYSVSESISDAFLTQVVKRLPPYNRIYENVLPKKSRTGKRNFSWERKKRR